MEQSEGNKDQLSKYLKTLKVRPRYNNLTLVGIIFDADKNAQSSFQSICSHLSNNGFSAPSENGDISSGVPAIGVFTFPDGTNSGMLEDICLDSVRNSSKIMNCLDQYFNCLEQLSLVPNNIAKSKISVWLASQKNLIKD